MTNTVLLIILLVNGLLMGALLVLAIQHGRAHLKSKKPAVPTEPQLGLPRADREELLHEAEDHFQKILGKAAGELQTNLDKTVTELNAKLEDLGTKVINDEIKRYNESIDRLRAKADAAVTDADAETGKLQDELKQQAAEHKQALDAKLDEEIAAEKARLVQQIDDNLTDTVMSLVIEALGHNIDLGAQGDYLLDVLNDHKDELKKGISG